MLILAAYVLSGCTSVQSIKTIELERLETADFIFYFPRGYQSASLAPAEKSVLYFYAKGGNSINISRYDYPAGNELNQQLCKSLAHMFDQSELRTMVNASEAKGTEFRSEEGMRSCYYCYAFHRGDVTSHVEYKVYQRKGSQAFAITAVYTENTPEQASLQKALHSFVIKKGSALP